MGPCVHKGERGRGVGCQKPEIEPAWLGFGSAMSNSGVERWWMLVRLFVRNNGVVGLYVHEREWGRGVGGLKLETERDGSVLGCIGVLGDRGGLCGLTDPPAVII